MTAPRRHRQILAGIAVVALLSAPLAASAEEDPNLDQTIESGQTVVTGRATLAAGHVDLGPRFVNGEWTFLVHDDAAKADPGGQSVWRYPDETIFHIVDAGQLPVPDDPAYGFIAAEPGTPVWVSPQTQNPEVVWLGWNTQDPEVMAAIDRGVTLTFHGVEGPGELAVFLQSGGFGEPEVLWTSAVDDPQSIWVDVNTHTHANWVFTEPGVYLVEIEASADLLDGTSVSDTQALRIAVGSSTDPTEAFEVAWEGPSRSADAATEDSNAAATTSNSDPLVPILIGLISVVAIGLVVVFTVVVIRGSRARARALGTTASEVNDD